MASNKKAIRQRVAALFGLKNVYSPYLKSRLTVMQDQDKREERQRQMVKQKGPSRFVSGET